MNKTDKAVELFKRTDAMHRCAFNRAVKSLDIHRSQHMVLMHLSHFNEPVSQKQIAEKFGISSAAIAVTVKKLEAKGLIQKIPDKKDGRYNCISLTEKGMELTKVTHTFFSEIDRRMFEGLSEEQLDTFIACHEKMQANLLAIKEQADEKMV